MTIVLAGTVVSIFIVPARTSLRTDLSRGRGNRAVCYHDVGEDVPRLKKNAARCLHHAAFRRSGACALYGMMAAFRARIGAGVTGLPAVLPPGLAILRPVPAPDHHSGLPHACTPVTPDLRMA